MAVLPASAKVDFSVLRETLRAKELRLAKEAEFEGLFPDSEVGAMPPFGNLYGLPVYADESLASDRAILFNAGTHQGAIRMSYRDFARLAEPQICSFAARPGTRSSCDQWAVVCVGERSDRATLSREGSWRSPLEWPMNDNENIRRFRDRTEAGRLLASQLVKG